MATLPTPAWALILAGGDGTRLRSLTTQIVGDARPKQFCPLFDSETLLDRTCRRADFLFRFDRQVVAVSRPHAPYYAYLAQRLLPFRLVEQPVNRDTAPAILYSLLRIADLAGDAPIAILPSDHYVSDDLAFMNHVGSALQAVQARADIVVLLGIEPSFPETEYGWIEAGAIPLPIAGDPVFPVRRFWEKPTAALAQQLKARGCLWNSFVMVGWLSTFLHLIRTNAPELHVAFEPVVRALGSPGEAAALERVYARLPAMSFSDCVLVPEPAGLAVLPVKGIYWSDWGNPSRVVACLRHSGRRPPWVARVTARSA